jgi:hypothetical protein
VAKNFAVKEMKGTLKICICFLMGELIIVGVWPAKFLGWRSVYLSYGKDEDCGVGNLWRMNLMYVALAVGSIAMLAAYLAWSIRRGHAKNMRIVEVANYVRNGTKAFIKSF